MPPHRAPLPVLLKRHLLVHGPTAAGALRTALGVSQPTFHRAVAAVHGELLVVGRGRATVYAARRGIPSLPAELPLYQVGESGSRALGRLIPVHPRGFFVDSAGPLAGFYPDLPWFLHDLRPNGFLGRLAPRANPELGLPADILRWSTDQVVVWLCAAGADLVGDLVLGDPSFRRWLDGAQVDVVDEEERAERYPALAEAVMGAGLPGSSAGGEQPKFLTARRRGDLVTPVLVKFSPRVADALSQRVADLLVCEHLALEAVARAEVAPAARSSLVRGGGRVFLEVERFDRVGPFGRRGLVSLLALDSEFAGSGGERWSTAAAALSGHLDAATQEQVLWLERFGDWIGNSDMHFGNLSFHVVEGRVKGLAPVYDMLPMRYAPRSGELLSVTLPNPVLSPSAGNLWRSAWEAALGFWQVVAEHPWISLSFRDTARSNAAQLADQAALLSRLPPGPAPSAHRPGSPAR